MDRESASCLSPPNCPSRTAPRDLQSWGKLPTPILGLCLRKGKEAVVFQDPVNKGICSWKPSTTRWLAGEWRFFFTDISECFPASAVYIGSCPCYKLPQNGLVFWAKLSQVVFPLYSYN